MDGTAAGRAGLVGVRELARLASSRLGRNVAASTITRAAQAQRIPVAARDAGKPLFDPSAALAAYVANTDPLRAAGAAARDSRPLDLDLVAPPPRPAPTPAPEAPPAPAPDLVAGTVNAHRARKAEIDVINGELDLAERQGAVAPVVPMRAAFGRQLAGFVTQVEVGLPVLAQSLADELGVDAHGALVLMRRWYRGLRADMAQAARVQSLDLPELAPVEEPATDGPGL